MAVFLIAVLTLYAVMNTMMFFWIRYMFHPAGMVRNILYILFWAAALMFPLGRVFAVRGTGCFIPFFQFTGNVWLGVLFYFFWISIITGIVRLIMVIGWLPEISVAHLRMTGSVICLVLSAILVFGFFRGNDPSVKTVNVDLCGKSVPPGGITLVQISDIHLECHKSEAWWDEVVRRVNEIRADFVLITGDLLDDRAELLVKFIPSLKSLWSRHGVYAVTGNHEFYLGIPELEKVLDAAGIRLLRNEMLTIPDRMHLIGVDDPTGRQFGVSGKPDLCGFTGRLGDRLPVILMNHQPIELETARQCGIDLQLSGHTHGGQIWPFNYFTGLAFQYQAGYHRFGNFHLVVSTGTGVWGPPFRIGTDSEIILINIRGIPGEW
ncbi:metallophosphoesterase [bacterium]|nr:metallophosphoesterase [candidate division CSSED10-310 bacterium]